MDSTVWMIALGAVGVVGVVVAVARRRPSSPPTPSVPRAVPAAARAAADRAAPAETVAPGAPAFEPPAALSGYHLRTVDDLGAEERRAMLATFREVPRPPRMFTRLVSMDLMHEASSSELVALISHEPLIAAKVLAAVNSPVHGLSRPVSGLGQAVAYLGVNRVRSICLQYTMISAFRSDNPERTRRLETVWQASALAAELTQYPLQATGGDDPGGLNGAVVLSFLGQLAVTTAVPDDLLARLPARDFLARSRAEQSLVGLPASEVGRLLLEVWELPPGIVDGVVALDRMMLTPWQPHGGAQATRRAFGYLCARVAERLAAGELAELESFDLREAPDAGELAAVRTHLADPAFGSLIAHWRSPHVTRRVAALRGARPPASATASPKAVPARA
jgi:HD-like signal output (HDOD) protein